MRRLAWLLALTAAPALAEPADAPLAGALGVQIEKPAGDHVHFMLGSGVYLGNGLILTAAHVVAVDPGNPVSTVVMDGWRTDARLVASEQGELDLALLKIEPGELSASRRSMKPLDICTTATTPNQPVVVAEQGLVGPSHTIDSSINAPALKGDWTNILATRYSQGASGGGVFDAYRGCLAGAISVGITTPGVALTQFVPAAQIAAFLAGRR